MISVFAVFTEWYLGAGVTRAVFGGVRVRQFENVQCTGVRKFGRVGVFFKGGGYKGSSLLRSLFVMDNVSGPLLPIGIGVVHNCTDSELSSLGLSFCGLSSSRPVRVHIISKRAQSLGVDLVRRGRGDMLLNGSGRSVLSGFRRRGCKLGLSFGVGSRTGRTRLRFSPGSSGGTAHALTGSCSRPLQYGCLDPGCSFDASVRKLDGVLRGGSRRFVIRKLRVVRPGMESFVCASGMVLISAKLRGHVPIGVVKSKTEGVITLLATVCRYPGNTLLVSRVDGKFRCSMVGKL